MSERCAFSLLEVVVVLGIIGILASLILPAVQQARSAAHRVECQNHLKQIGLALQQYHETYGVLPPGLMASGCDFGNSTDYQNHIGPIVAVFPFLELPPFCEAVSEGLRKIPVLTCPADGTDAFPYPLSYPASVDLGDNAGPRTQGPFSVNWPKQSARLGDATDGTSQTAAISERVVFYAGGSERSALAQPPRYMWRVTVPPVSAATLADPFAPDSIAERWEQTITSVDDCLYGPRRFEAHDQPLLANWRVPGDARARYCHTYPPNAPHCLLSGPGLDYPFLSAQQHGASSAHQGGVNVSFLDGHVQFITETIDLELWRALGTMDGGEPVSTGAL